MDSNLSSMILELRKCLNIEDVDEFSRKLFSHELTAKEKALLNYLATWVSSSSPNKAFEIERFISSDLSGILLGKAPVIFMGSNDWAEKRFYSYESLNVLLEKWNRHLSRIVPKLMIPVFLVVVPEKDVFVRNLSKGESHWGSCEDVASDFLARLSVSVAGYCFLEGALNFFDKEPVNYLYYDTHLLSRDYLNIYHSIMKGLDLEKEGNSLDVRFERGMLFGDLDEKLKNPRRKSDFLHFSIDGNVRQVSGKESFSSPLRDTFQCFKCESPLVGGKIVVCGDSHCSIYSQRKLTYLLANSFGTCDFYWDPFCMSGDVSVFHNADFVVLEISERFLFS